MEKEISDKSNRKSNNDVKMKEDKTFLRVTNRDIYNKIIGIEEKLDKLGETNKTDHFGICERQDTTNGKVKLSMWIGTSALALGTTLAGFFFIFLAK